MFPKRLAAANVLASVAWTACSASGPAPPPAVELGRSFSLRVGESVQTRDARLRVGVEAVLADSRCPKGEQCVWAGDATARVWVQNAAGARETRELHTAANAAQSARVAGHELHLLRLDPVPVSGRALVPGDYVLTLELRRGTAAALER
jgi:hypothetical protein